MSIIIEDVYNYRFELQIGLFVNNKLWDHSKW